MMERSFSEALKQRRTYYSITNQSPISDQEIECIVNMTVRHVPSAFNSQTTRVVLLLGESHKKLWQIVKDALKKIGPQEAFPSYQENFPGWSLQTSAMHQLAIWVMLEDVGFGASLQHYNPLIDEEVRRAWNLPEHWHLIAEMPFGLPIGKPGEKEFQPLEERVRIFK